MKHSSPLSSPWAGEFPWTFRTLLLGHFGIHGFDAVKNFRAGLAFNEDVFNIGLSAGLRERER